MGEKSNKGATSYPGLNFKLHKNKHCFEKWIMYAMDGSNIQGGMVIELHPVERLFIIL